MRIAIDARSLVTRPTGVGHFLLAAVNAWSDLHPHVEFLLLAHKPLHEAAKSILRVSENVQFHLCPTHRFSENGLWWMVFGFARHANALSATHLWGAGGVLPLFGTRSMERLLTIHDLVFRSLPRTMALRTLIEYNLMSGYAIRNADYLWAVSKFTADEITNYYPKRRSRCIVVGSGLNTWRTDHEISAAEVASVALKYNANQRTLLFVGTLEPRKNLSFLLSLMPRLSELGWRLLVVGCAGWGTSGIASIINVPGFPSDSVVFCDYLPDIHLQALYRCVGFFISTSLMEGFGLPHLEAMHAGCPVIAPKNSAVIEVVGSAGTLVQGWKPDDWIDAIECAREKRVVLQAEVTTQAGKFDMRSVCQAVTCALKHHSNQS